MNAPDPALVAAKKLQEATVALRALPDSNYADEQKPEYKAALEREKEADFAFSTAPVTSLAGALTKLRSLAKDIGEDSGPDAWYLGHVNPVAAFLEGLAGAAQAEPLLGLWAEQNRLVALGNALETDLEIDALGDKLSAVEHQIANTEARTLAGVVVQIKLRESVLGHDHWVLSAALTRNVVNALERMAGAA